MRVIVFLSAFLAVTWARPQYASAGPPSSYSAPPSGGGGGGGYGAPAPSYGAPAQPPIVQKHVYVHVPPPEPDNRPAPKIIPVQPARKHYKIVFIKAPTAPPPTVPVIPPQPQNEEKTLIYVLVKKPEEAPELNIPTPAPTQPSKPEVYFIRYKTQKEEGGGGGYPPSGVPQSQYGAPSSSGGYN
ncbi:proline-rich extensin-like protein EPR1 [Agrilus planipennis]|uniref:Proline-rich extensin-like protein EPR1 n=1 Tax=Agrilus planipennis TaxID=224129 RepID=A0A1W4WCJ4_AGRPL|nr:proline-rich extensin-like protein EPR1 [Agrilus planipennis]